ncbi:YciI family protein [Kribbella sp. NPDC051770]|uniref:YciI family protein n=1 Tax=Kribbella sp. NPDC051770 TaxID=3155413 RepID=UPI003443F199
MAQYLLYFNQQWVGDHPEEWFAARSEFSTAAVEEMKAAGVYVFAGGLEERSQSWSADPTQGEEVLITDGPYVESKEFLGGFAIVDVADDEAAKYWGAKIAAACGWPHEIRRVYPERKES